MEYRSRYDSKIMRNGTLKTEIGSLPIYKSCLEGKITKRSFMSKGNHAVELLELIYNDVCCPIKVQISGGYEYFITFINDHQDMDIFILCAERVTLSTTFMIFER